MVPSLGDDEKAERLVGFDERVDYLKGRGGIDVPVHLADNEHQLTLQEVCIIDVGRGCVLRSNGPAHPLFTPPDLVHAIVMTSADGNCYFVELGMEEERAHRTLSSCR